jgi:hypothetical protein
LTKGEKKELENLLHRQLDIARKMRKQLKLMEASINNEIAELDASR